MKVSPKTLWTWIPISVIVFLVACWVSTGWQPSQSRTRTAVLTSTDTGAPKDVTARGWVESNRVSYGEKIPFWITFVNASDHEIQNLKLLSFQAPGFKPAPPCWTSSKPLLPSCVDGASSLPTSLKSGDSVTLSAKLEATSSPGRYGLSAVFSWKNPGGERARKALLLGPVEVTYPLADSLFPITQKAYAAGKDFGLPLAVAVLTFVLGVLEQKRKDDRIEAEEQRKRDLEQAEKRHKEEQEKAERDRREHQKLDEEHRAQVQQTWSQLLQKHLRDAQLYYLPISGKLIYLRSRVLQQPPDVRECFYWLMAFMRRVRFTSDGIGGVHLKSRRAEDVFVSSWATLRDATDRLGKAERSEALDRMKPNESFSKFEKRFASGDALFAGLAKEFEAWLKDPNDPFERYLCLASIMLEVLEFETNRPFEYWYDKPVEFPREKLRDALKNLKNVPNFVDKWKVRESLELYLSGEKGTEREPLARGPEAGLTAFDGSVVVHGVHLALQYRAVQHGSQGWDSKEPVPRVPHPG